jgi:hypothetical protein
MANLLLTIICLVAWLKGAGIGFLCLLAVWIFGIFASVVFLRRKSMRPLFLALGLAVSVSTVYLIVLPIWDATTGADTPPPVIANSPPIGGDGTDLDDPPVQRIELDPSRIFWGVAVLLLYAALSIYLNTPRMKRQFQK